MKSRLTSLGGGIGADLAQETGYSTCGEALQPGKTIGNPVNNTRLQ